MEKTEIILLAVAIVASLYGYVHYGRQIPGRRLQPRPFTWLIWGVLSTCVSVIQIKHGANLGTIGALLGAASGYVLAGMSWHYGKRRVYKTDVVSLALAGCVLACWVFAGDAITVIMATAVYMIGFIPTVARAWKAPHKEGRMPFAMSVLKYVISFILLGSVSLETAMYPVALAMANLAFLCILAVRSRKRAATRFRNHSSTTGKSTKKRDFLK